MSESIINVWKLFSEFFKDGDEVIVVHENCNIYCGKLRATDELCQVGTKDFPWKEIVFVAHDGFPCKALHTALSNEQLGKIDGVADALLLRKILTLEKSKPTKKAKIRSVSFGCPYEIQEVNMQVINPFAGNKENYEETLLCTAKDGAIGMLWDLDNEVIEFYP